MYPPQLRHLVAQDQYLTVGLVDLSIFPRQEWYKMWNLWLFAVELWADKKIRTPMSIWTRKKCSVAKNSKMSCQLDIWLAFGVPIAMHYVRTLCDKYLLSYDGFCWFVTGRFRPRVLKHSVGYLYTPVGPLTPPVQASSGQEWYYIRSAWHLISLW